MYCVISKISGFFSTLMQISQSKPIFGRFNIVLATFIAHLIEIMTGTKAFTAKDKLA